MDVESAVVLTSVGGAVGEIVLNRPDQRNAVNLPMCEELIESVRRLEADPAVRVVIVRANGPVFCAGADIKERREMTPAEVRARRVKAFAAYEAIERLSKPVVAMVHGAVVGSGGEIAAACDFVIASADATFRYPEAIGGTVGATQRLPRIVGLARAKELLFTGRTLSAAEALAWGLVNRVVEPSDLDATVRALAGQIAAAPPLSMRLTKRSLVDGSATDRRGALAVELLAIEELLSNEATPAGLSKLETMRKDSR